MKNKLYKKRIALLLALVLSLQGALPVSASSLTDGAGAAAVTAEAVSDSGTISQETTDISQEPEQEPTQDTAPLDSGELVAEEAVEEAVEEELSGEEADDGSVSEAAALSEDTVSGGTVSSDEPEEMTVSVSMVEEVSEAGAADESVSADLTIMYYMVGSNLEGEGVQATRDMIEIMTGMENAYADFSSESRASVNVIVETGGVSDNAMKSGGSHETALKELKESLNPGGSSDSANDLKLLNVINDVNNGNGIQWNQNERWALTADVEGSAISKALNDSDENRTRVMTGIKKEGRAPELEDFITTTVEKYPANQYMLVLWDHGGGPKGGFGGDDRSSQDNTYITAEQLTSSLSSACAGIRDSEWDCNKDFNKFAFIGFDACLMGNLETAMALAPYAEYLIASEDLEPGTGWDHRGYVKEMYYPSWCQQLKASGYLGSMGYPSANSASANDIKDTVKDIGCQLVEDNTAYYNEREIKSTMSVVSLNGTGLSDLNAELEDLAKALKAQLTSGSKFDRDAYLKILEAAGESVNFNDSGEGIVDLYSFCKKLAGKFGSGEVATKADAVAVILKPNEHKDVAANDHDLITMQQYTNSYYFSRSDEGFKKLGGLSIFLPYRNNRFTYEEGDTTETFDGLKEYLDIYKKVLPPSATLSGGYADLLRAFCAAQAIGAVLSEKYNNEPSVISTAMEKVKTALESDYDPLDEPTKTMLGSMAKADGEIIKGRISTNDCYMKSMVQDGGEGLRYLLALDEDKKVMVKNIRQQLVLSGNNGQKFRLGFLPAAFSVPEKKDREYQYFTDNQKNRKWFFMGDYPAAVFNIRNLDNSSQQDYFDPFGETAILAQFPAVMEKKGGNYSQGVVIEAEFEKTSENGVVPKGYYTYDTDTKQLNGFVPWDVEALEDYNFWPQSDLGEYFEGAANDFNAEDNTANVYTGALSARELTFSRDREFSEGLKDNDEIAKGTFDYILMDIFGGRYWLDSPDSGEVVQTYLYLRSKDGNPPHGSIDYISRNCSDIEPVLEMKTYSGEYTLSFDEADMPEIGYYDDDGDFNKLSTGEDFAALPSGTYRIVFKDYDEKVDRLIIDEGAKVIIDGVSEKVSASNYIFFFYGSFPVLTVGDTDSGLDISYGPRAGDGEFPYGIYKTLDSEKPENDLWDFITVKNGGNPLTDLQYVRLSLSANGKTHEINAYEETRTELEAFKQELNIGDKFTVSAEFVMGNEGEVDTLKTEDLLEFEIVKQPVRIYGTNPFEAYEFDNDNLFWDNKDYYTGGLVYSPSINVVMTAGGKEFTGKSFKTVFGHEADTVDDLISLNNVPAIYIDNGEAYGVGNYKNLYFGPGDGSGDKKPVSWETKHFSADFNKYFTVEDEDVILEEYNVHPATQVYFKSLKDDTTLFEDRIVFFDENAIINNGRYMVSEGSIKIPGSAVKQWYMGIGSDRCVSVYLDGAPVPYGEYKELVTLTSNGEWQFYLPKEAVSQKVYFYAGYEVSVVSFNETGKTSFGISMDPIKPVEYTGKAIVTVASGKNGSRTIDLVLKDSAGNVLKEGTDYTVSYKNNKNAASLSSKKVPTLIIKGKGDTYKKFRAEAKFTILPADLRYAQVAANRQFAPFTGKGKLNVKTTLKLPSGVKIPASQLDIRVFSDGEELTAARMKSLYKGKEAKQVEIRVSAKKPEKGAINYRIGSLAPVIYVTGYPKGGRKLSVKLNNSKRKFTSSIEVSELTKDLLKAGSPKIAGKTVPAEDLLPVKAYFDKNLVYPAGSEEDGTKIDKAGTYYLAYEIKDEKKGEYRSFVPQVVKYIMTGEKLKKGKTRIGTSLTSKSNTYAYNNGEGISVNICIDKARLKADKMYVTCTEKDGRTVKASVGYAANETDDITYDYKIDKDGILVIDGLENGARGSYTLTFEGGGSYTGSFKLTYKVK